MKKPTITVFAFTIFLGSQIVAQEPIQQKERDPEKLFARMDTNGDGSIDKLEFEAIKEKREEKTGKEIDGSKLFSKIDANNDGSISKEEFNTHHAQIQANRKDRDQGNKPEGKHNPEQLFSRMDANGDGSIDKSEFDAIKEKREEKTGKEIDGSKLFSKIDANNDGSISKEEFNTHQNQMQERRLNKPNVKGKSK